MIPNLQISLFYFHSHSYTENAYHRHMVIDTNNLVSFGFWNPTHNIMENIVVTENALMSIL